MKREDKIRKLAAAIQREIVSCPNEQSRHDGDSFWISGSCTDLQDLLSNHEVPEELEEKVVARLRCPSCGTSFEIHSEVGTKYDFEVEHENIVDQAMRKHGKQLFDFYGFLHKKPLLGAQHPFGKKILREIKKAPRVASHKTGWFRARVNKEHGFGPAPAELVADQRYNSSGQSRWYFADNAETSVAETAKLGTAWVQKFDVGQLERLLDLRSWRADDDRAIDAEGEYHPPHDLLVVSLVFGDLLTQRHYLDEITGQPESEARQWKPEYLVSRFVAEATNAAGFEGILCGSVRYPGENLVVFDSNWSPKPIGDPVSVTLDEDAMRLRKNYFLNQGEGLAIPDVG
ncbi:MAG: hypothetical protein JWR26_1603 [Pedosphaera sp.]|nr:hypothetical protein [Pedosphaera sp.]